MKLFGKAALVTGAARRLGRAIALALAEEGCDVAIAFRTSADEAEETARRVRGLGRRAMLLEADLADPQAAAALPGRVAAKFGGLNIVVNNASVFEPAPLAKLDAATMQRTLAVNVVAPVLIARAAAEHLKTAGDGRIVNVTDISSERPWTGYLAYCASKAALESATRSLAKELAPHILVNAVAPGIVTLPEGMDDAARDAIVERIPVRRVGSPEEVAAGVMYFIRDARYTSGMILRVDGGRCIAW